MIQCMSAQLWVEEHSSYLYNMFVIVNSEADVYSYNKWIIKKKIGRLAFLRKVAIYFYKVFV